MLQSLPVTLFADSSQWILIFNSFFSQFQEKRDSESRNKINTNMICIRSFVLFCYHSKLYIVSYELRTNQDICTWKMSKWFGLFLILYSLLCISLSVLVCFTALENVNWKVRAWFWFYVWCCIVYFFLLLQTIDSYYPFSLLWYP